MKVNGKLCYLWRAVDHEGEVLESVVTAKRDKAAALKFLKRIMKKYGRPRNVVTDGLCSYPAAMKEVGIADRQEVGRRLNNRAENSHQPFRRRERAMQRFRSMKTLQKFSSVRRQVVMRAAVQRRFGLAPVHCRVPRRPLELMLQVEQPDADRRADDDDRQMDDEQRRQAYAPNQEAGCEQDARVGRHRAEPWHRAFAHEAERQPPLVKFALTPDDIECALALDDTVIWGGLALMVESSDECVSKFAERLRDRKLYKCIDVRAKIAHDKGDIAASSSEADTVCAGIRDEIGTYVDARS